MKYPLAFAPLLLVPAALASDVTELETIVVNSTNPYAALTNNKISGNAHLKMLGQQDTFRAPLNVVSYSEDIIADQQTRNITDFLGKNDVAVTPMGGEAFVLDGISVRGMRIFSREFSLNGLPGLFAGYQSSTAYVGSVDLIKGASGGLGSMSPESAVGGAVNVQSKVAGDEDINRLGVGWFSNNRLQTDADVSHRVGTNKEWGLRFNAQYRNGDTARQYQAEENASLALNADYRGDRLRGQIDLIRNNRNNDAMRARLDQTNNLDFQVPAAPDGKTNLAQPWTWADTGETIIAATAEADISDNITVSGGVGHNDAKYDHLFSQMRLRGANGDYQDHTVRSYAMAIDTTSANLGIKGRHTLGAISHDWAASADYIDRDRSNAFNENNGATSYRQNNNIYNVIHFSRPSDINYRFTNKTTNTNRHHSFGATDTLGFADDTIRLTLGARFQHLRQYSTNAAGTRSGQYKDHAINPLLALAWQPQEDFIIYGNYMRDLEPGDVVNDTGAANYGEQLAPMKTEQVEIGVRKDWGNIATTAALFQIDRPAAYLSSATSRYDIYGNTRHRGLELNVYGAFVNDTLRPGVGITWMQAKLKDQDNGVNNGKQIIGTPTFIAKAGVEWDTPWVNGLTLKSGVQHYGKTYQDAANRYTIKGNTLFDAGMRYHTTLGGKKLTVGASVENLFNEKYWQTSSGNGGIILGMPRTYWLNARIDL